MSPTQRAVAHMRADAERFDGLELRPMANLCRQFADMVEAALQEQRKITTDPDGAERYSGYTKSHLRKLVRDGVVKNIARKHAPRFTVDDLPIKPGHIPPEDWWKGPESESPNPAPAAEVTDNFDFDAAAIAQQMFDAA